MRQDLPEIIKSIKNNGHLPYTTVVTNGGLLDEEKYLDLRGMVDAMWQSAHIALKAFGHRSRIVMKLSSK